MLEALRRGATGWVAKIFIALLVVSFGIWGIADIFRGYGQSSLAEVGAREITADEFQFAYQNELRRIGNQIGRALTSEEARALGLDQRVLNRLVSEAALQAQGEELNLGISDKAISHRTVNEPAFQDATGRFNQGLFAEILRANGLTEQTYLNMERQADIRRQLTHTVDSAVGLPQTLLEAANRFQNETRTLDYFVLPASKLEPIAAATEEQLKAYYDSNKAAFTAPEMRKLGLLIVTPDTLKDTIAVSEEDIKQRYEANKDSYGSPERRHVLQIVFPDQASAQAAFEKIKQGADFATVARERGYSQADIDLGKVTKSQIVDPAVAEAAFALEKGAVSEPVAGSLGTVLLQVTEIEPGVTKTFDDVKDSIRDALVRERAADDALDIRDKVEDERGAGVGLAEIARKLNLQYREIAGVTRAGTDAAGAPVDIPAAGQVIAEAFDSDVGVENDPIETADRGFVWVDVLEVMPERLKPFEDVRAEVESAWRRAEERRRLADMAQSLVNRIKGGESLDSVAQSLGLEVKHSPPLKRSASPTDGLSRAAIAQAFALSEGGIGSAPADDGSARVVFKVAKVTPPPPLAEADAEALRGALGEQLSDDMVSAYLDGLREKYGVTVNPTLFNQLTGRDAG